ncbi:MAG: sulfite exporter TauE/SafE family protein [Candidatus Omnitrophota bacterium]|nr:sulfite exporter TauE/SafE family protein [Candidatus Omnitrophota bacterium]
MSEFAQAWYQVLNSLFLGLGAPLREIALAPGASLLGASLLGVLGATSPCQLSTNASAIAYLGLSADQPGRRIAWTAGAYIAGKILVFGLAGVLAVMLKEELQSAAIPIAVVIRKALGPLMLLVGLAMLGVWRPRLALGHAFSLRLRQRVAGGPLGAFLLGIAFSFAFCPTLGLLFFGYVIPMSIASSVGILYPAAFALGTTAPLILMSSVLGFSSESWMADRLGRLNPWIGRAAGAIFLLAGINDTLLYWFL